MKNSPQNSVVIANGAIVGIIGVVSVYVVVVVVVGIARRYEGIAAANLYR